MNFYGERNFALDLRFNKIENDNHNKQLKSL